VEKIYELAPASASAFWNRAHTLSDHVELNTPETELAAAAAEDVCQALRDLRVSDDDSVRCGSRGLANVLRRALMTRIPTLAIDTVGIRINESGTIDEVLAHRFGQLALDGAAEVATFSVDVVGRPVLARDVAFDDSSVRVCARDCEVSVVPLGLNQRFAATGRCVRGIGLRHAKFSAVCAVPVWEYPHLKAPIVPPRGVFVDHTGLVLLATTRAPLRYARAVEIFGDDALWNGGFCTLVIDSLGDRNAAECVDLAVAAVEAEVADYIKALKQEEGEECAQQTSAA
jgi:hypothetical protein